ncbi:hypothetical protein B0T18DRAFT_484051 [Schizothecium vesticola]|uniref:Uncharacterized protein n=1 Tax=Schizothecium vesticola TaxID=314040 RepID=A0AA40F8N7_9PEZI|nr:hypothetical protein B0T18DRAFT_484051 [Schizothecium vesticola]
MALTRLCHVTQRWLLGAPPLGAIQRSKGSSTGREAVMIRRQPAGAVASGIGRDAAGQFGWAETAEGPPFLAASSPKPGANLENWTARAVSWGALGCFPSTKKKPCVHDTGRADFAVRLEAKRGMHKAWFLPLDPKIPGFLDGAMIQVVETKRRGKQPGTCCLDGEDRQSQLGRFPAPPCYVYIRPSSPYCSPRKLEPSGAALVGISFFLGRRSIILFHQQEASANWQTMMSDSGVWDDPTLLRKRTGFLGPSSLFQSWHHPADAIDGKKARPFFRFNLGSHLAAGGGNFTTPQGSARPKTSGHHQPASRRRGQEAPTSAIRRANDLFVLLTARLRRAKAAVKSRRRARLPPVEA